MRRVLSAAGLLLSLGLGLVWLNPPAHGLGAIVFDGPQHGGGGITVVCHTHAAALSGTTTPAVDCTGATLLVVTLGTFAGGSATATDSSSNTYTASACSAVGGGNDAGCIWWDYSPTVTSSMTFSATGTNVAMPIEVIGFSGTAGSSIDQDSNQTIAGAGTTCQSASITPGTANQVVVSGSVYNGGASSSYSVDSGLTISDSDPFTAGVNYGGALAYIIETSAVAKQPTWTSTVSTSGINCMTASFK